MMTTTRACHRNHQIMSSSSSFSVINPTHGKVVGTYDRHAPDQVDAFIHDAHAAHLLWRNTDFSRRAECVEKIAAILRERKNEFATMMAEEMGKPIRSGKSELDKCAWVCDYYAENAERFLTSRPVDSDSRTSYIAHQPLGVILAVMPWNFPFWQVYRFLAPALMAGNGVVLKHAANVPGSALAIEEVFVDSGAPHGLFKTLLIGSEEVERVLENKQIVATTLTGSTAAGRAVASKAGEMLKKSVLELGGSDPYVILADADLDGAARACAQSRLINSGQSCIAAKRFVVVDGIHDEFVEKLAAEMEKYVMGDPTDERTDVGPQARADLRDELVQQVDKSIARGAKVVLGGTTPSGPGSFYPPTILSDVDKGMPAYDEELFGPVAAVIRAKNEEDAIHIANDSEFGLGAAVFTRDVERGRRIAEHELHAGCCSVNAFVKSDPRLPFGGIKNSGYGRELSDLGIKEFVNQKTICIG